MKAPSSMRRYGGYIRQAACAGLMAGLTFAFSIIASANTQISDCGDIEYIDPETGAIQKLPVQTATGIKLDLAQKGAWDGQGTYVLEKHESDYGWSSEDRWHNSGGQSLADCAVQFPNLLDWDFRLPSSGEDVGGAFQDLLCRSVEMMTRGVTQSLQQQVGYGLSMDQFVAQKLSGSRVGNMVNSVTGQGPTYQYVNSICTSTNPDGLLIVDPECYQRNLVGY